MCVVDVDMPRERGCNSEKSSGPEED
jgi:hypothetical protein